MLDSVPCPVIFSMGTYVSIRHGTSGTWCLFQFSTFGKLAENLYSRFSITIQNKSVKFMYEYRRWAVYEALLHFTTDTIDFHNAICNPAFSVWMPDTHSQGSDRKPL